MINISQNKILIVALIGIASAIVIFSGEDQKTSSTPVLPQQGNKPEAYIEGAQFRLFDSKGFSTTLLSSKAFLYPDDDGVDIETPRVRLVDENGSVIELSAETGKLQPENESLVLKGQVEIKQVFPKDKTWTISGNEFYIDNKQRFISSDQAVTIQKDKSIIRAIGLQAWLSEKRIELLGSVRGQYAFSE